MTTSRRLSAAALVLTAAMTLAGCGSQDPDPSGDPTTGGSTGAGPSESAVPSDWQEAKIDVAQVHLPPDWTVRDSDSASMSFAAAKDDLGLSPGSATVTAGVNSSSGDIDADIESTTKFHLETFNGDPNLKNVKRLPDVKINGVRFSHIQWEVGPSWRSEYVTITPDGAWAITIGWGFTKSGLDRKGTQELIDPVMETFEFR